MPVSLTYICQGLGPSFFTYKAWEEEFIFVFFMLTILEQYTSCLVMAEYKYLNKMNNINIEGFICKWPEEYPQIKQAHIFMFMS